MPFGASKTTVSRSATTHSGGAFGAETRTWTRLPVTCSAAEVARLHPVVVVHTTSTDREKSVDFVAAAIADAACGSVAVTRAVNRVNAACPRSTSCTPSGTRSDAEKYTARDPDPSHDVGADAVEPPVPPEPPELPVPPPLDVAGEPVPGAVVAGVVAPGAVEPGADATGVVADGGLPSDEPPLPHAEPSPITAAASAAAAATLRAPVVTMPIRRRPAPNGSHRAPPSP